MSYKRNKIVDMRPVQGVVLEMYKIFKGICEKHSLRFFAISGTTLGAVLWEGFIPWDDDMDIAMPPQDYKKFVKVCKNELPDHLMFSEYTWFGGKLHNKNTMFTNVYFITKPDRYNGIFLDIVPLVGLPSNKVAREKFVDDARHFHRWALLSDVYDINTRYSKKDLKDWADRIMHGVTYDSAKYVMDFSDPRYVLKSAGFLHPIDLRFEDTTIPVSSNHHDDLTIQYGKYTKNPPMKSRRSLHQELGILDLDRGFNEYASDYKKISPAIRAVLDSKHHYEGGYYNDIVVRDHEINQLHLGIIAWEKLLESVREENAAIKDSLTYRVGSLVLKPIKFMRGIASRYKK